ncbi:hypothetical protein IPC1385_21035 [Pseudomonas aeruginosa]|nr:hypothetical protein CDC17_25925 [Pseudomonas aeruginosa]RUD25705.1 hypothetical protein IPC1385_21035 [Pseudomonas aeruginosa]
MRSTAPKVGRQASGPGGAQADSGCGVRRGRTALYRVQRRGRAVVSSVRSREGRAGAKRPRWSLLFRIMA